MTQYLCILGECVQDSFLYDSDVNDEKNEKKKVARALLVLHIRQSKFQSLYDARRHGKVSNIKTGAIFQTPH